MSKYGCCQNGVILSLHDSKDDAHAAVADEMKKDFISILFRRKLRKLFKKSGNVALHRYTILTITEVEEVK